MGTLRARLNKKFSQKTYPDLADPNVFKAMAAGRKEFEEKYLGKTYPWILADWTYIDDDQTYQTKNPCDRTMVIGTFPAFSEKDAPLFFGHGFAKALYNIRIAGLNFAKTVPWPKRVKLLLEISKVVQEWFWLLVAAKQYETGQGLMEAIGETDETVDFPLFVAMCLEEINEDLLLKSPKFAGNYNGKGYVPHGVFLNICPFNFPDAIPIDMACKALAMGNAFIEKSSNKSSLCGYLVYESIRIAFERLGIPHEGVVNYAPGGPEVVDLLLQSHNIAGVSFTGSSAALASIKEKHGKMLRNGFHGRAPLVYGSEETSGVNIVAVWHDANMLRAASECVKSFVGRSGQKCSSARVIIVHERVKDLFTEHLEEELKKIRYGNVLDGRDVSPLITEEANTRMCLIIEDLFEKRVVENLFPIKSRQRIIYKEPLVPTILFASKDVLEDEDKAQTLMNTEIFGPVATVIFVPDLEKIEWLCQFSDYALTGGYFAVDVDACLALEEIIPAGNLYGNRKCTGALVGGECFGGLRSRSSPTGRKGKDALPSFGSLQTHSGFYPPSWSEEERKRFIKHMEEKLGVVFSKT
ncbi:MAG: aldehyde dehydrogenase family protein [bacterium]|nr:aldehyde dehydrogenase family protein [bacterium]